MKASAFDYVRAKTTAEACALLAEHGPDARLLAGGQSLLPAMNLRLTSPGMLIDTGRIGGLDAIEVRGKVLRIGALARHQAVLRDARVAEHVPLLTEALRHVAHPAIRAWGNGRREFGGELLPLHRLSCDRRCHRHDGGGAAGGRINGEWRPCLS